MLKHVRLPLMKYVRAAEVQDNLVRKALDSKASRKSIQATLLTMEMKAVYTTGRRERGLLTHDELSELRKYADVVESLRGGQTTYHGPGQLVAYPIIDLIAGKRLTPKCYVDRLEQSLIETLKEFEIHAFRTENTGVWVSETHKIGAIGVHMRRGITSHGIALNICNDLTPFERIIACGLPDKRTTSMLEQGRHVSVEEVTQVFVKLLSTNLGFTEVIEGTIT